ncbi:hypothetical protein EDB85DRAFT_1898421 [Lactarius pseudohatsudake]|nr:hypothetical protein EDB85DRAFT_1898421 [Lactarius pseudohatsudake]
MNSSVARLPKTSARMTSAGRHPQTSARMTSAGRQPRSFPSPQHDDVSDGDANDDDLNDMDMEWSYDKCTTLILHDADDCTFCSQWGRHYFMHVRGSCRTLQEARELLQGTLTQDLAALHSEIQQLQGAVASLVASQREDAHPTRRRKLVHPPPTRASTPSVEAISPGPSSNMRRDT